MRKKNKVHDVNRFKFEKEHSYLFDTNLWLFLFPPAGKPAPSAAKPYSKALKDILACKAAIVVEPVVLCEYMNAYCKIEHNAWLRKNSKEAVSFTEWKKFRKSANFSEIGKAVISEAKSILEICKKQTTPFPTLELPDMFDAFAAGHLDFNDVILTETCRLGGWKMLTHDADMLLGDIDVITGNRALLTLDAVK